MFNSLSERLSNTVNQLRGIGRLTEKNIEDTLREVRKALLEADVALDVVKTFTDQVKEAALGQEVMKSIRPGEALVKIVNDQLTDVLGGDNAELNLSTEPPAIILMAGLQGSGKTTTTAKLAHWLKQEKKKKVMLVSADVYRPAAIDQLETLAKQIDVPCFPSNAKQKPKDIVKAAIKEAKLQFIDVLFIDTAGRLHLDQELMDELKQIHTIAQPSETLLVVDSMAGQDAANTAKAFHEAIGITGTVLTKTDGDSRGGAALSMRIITGQPIKFIGTGEKIDGLEPFHPKRIASRILGMGDIVSLVEEAEKKIDRATAEKLNKKLKKGKSFDFNDFRDQLQQMNKMGGMKSLLGKLPNMPQMPKGAAGLMDESLLKRMEAMINSMTKKERKFPALINGSRKKRITQGSGTSIQDVNKLLKQFTQMQKMMKKMKGGKMAKRMKQMQQMQGQLPPELLDKLPKDFM
ncbi:MAG: signal recognition particle protein [Coxiellaceae bacterium]|nr:signal recognition particle protein [Coxiellaceae bacterium]